jgi:hypothetical protein
MADYIESNKADLQDALFLLREVANEHEEEYNRQLKSIH